VADHAEALRPSFHFQDQLKGMVNSLVVKRKCTFWRKSTACRLRRPRFRSPADVLNFLPGATFPICKIDNQLKAIYGTHLWGAAGQKMFIVRSEAELLDNMISWKIPPIRI